MTAGYLDRPIARIMVRNHIRPGRIVGSRVFTLMPQVSDRAADRRARPAPPSMAEQRPHTVVNTLDDADAGGMHLTHLGLPVRDLQRSQSFYARHFGFDPATARLYDDGTVILRNDDGFELALHRVASLGPIPEFLHFGFRLANPTEVVSVLGRLEAAGAHVLERTQEAENVSFKCVDPDGHRVEVYWEP